MREILGRRRRVSRSQFARRTVADLVPSTPLAAALVALANATGFSCKSSFPNSGALADAAVAPPLGASDLGRLRTEACIGLGAHGISRAQSLRHLSLLLLTSGVPVRLSGPRGGSGH